MPVFFVTGSKDKFGEVKAVIPNLEQLDINLPEIQEINPELIIKAKLEEALIHTEGSLIVEDTSLYFDALNGLPGPLIKWFLKTLKNEGLVRLTRKLENNRAIAKTVIGYAESASNLRFFEGIVHGEIVSPRGENGFGWDKIFKPDGHEKTFAEMDQAEKRAVSMRRVAVNKLREFLE